MCTSIILFRKDHEWPLIIGSNRDEQLNRKSKFPDRHWLKTYPKIIGGFDEKKHGTWLGINDDQIIGIIHNRKLDQKNKFIIKSRGEIILDLLNYDNIDGALEYLQKLNNKYYKGFNIFIGSKNYCFWGKHSSPDKKIEINEIQEGLSILTNKDLNDSIDKKSNFYLKKFSQSPIPDPSCDNWLSWELILSMNTLDNQKFVHEAICFNDKENNYGTKSSALISIPNHYKINKFKKSVIFKATENAPNLSYFKDVEMD